MRVIYFNARGSRHILGGDFRLFQSGSHLSFLRHMLTISQNSQFSKPPRFCVRTVNFQILRGIHFGYFKVHKSPMISIGGSEAQKN